MLNWVKTLLGVNTPTKVKQDALIKSVKKQAAKNKSGWTQKPHVRQGHYRTYANGNKVWIPEMKINK